MISDGLLLDVVGSEGKGARGCVRSSFAPVSGLMPHLFGCCLKGGSRCADVQMGSLWTWSG